MAITTIDGVLAGLAPPTFFSKAASGTLVAGRPFTPFYTSGVPGAAVGNSAGMSGAALTSYAGQLPIPAASNNTHLARFSGVSSAQAGMLLLCDRLWHQSGINVTSTGAQTINSVAWPARDRDGSTNGAGVYIGLEVSAATGSGTATPSISYTESGNTSGHTSTTVDAYVASSAVGSFYRLGLAAGHVGVRSVQSVTLGVSMSSGTIHLVAYRVLAALELAAAGLPNAVDALTGGLPRLYDNTVPFLVFVPLTTTTTLLTGSAVFTQG